MRSVSFVLTLAATAAFAAPAFAATQTQTATEAPTATAPAAKPKPAVDPNRIVCIREHVVGSNRPQKVCMTVAERDRMRDAAARLVTEQRGATAPREGVGR